MECGVLGFLAFFEQDKRGKGVIQKRLAKPRLLASLWFLVRRVGFVLPVMEK